MNARPVPRIKLIRATTAQRKTHTDAILREGIGAAAPNEAWFQPATTKMHAPACACCQARNPAGVAIATLLFAAARGHAPPFQRLVVITITPAGAAAIDHTLANDPLVRARFRTDVPENSQ